MSPDGPTEPALGDRDRTVLDRAGIAIEEAERQLRLLRQPPPPIRLVGACHVGDGIVVLSDEERPRLLDRWREAAAAGRIVKLVPASGAASRMFASLSRARRELATSGRVGDADDAADLAAFLRGLDDLAFAPVLREAATTCDTAGLLDALLGEAGLDYERRPKALIPFHREAGVARTALEEHLAEAIELVRDGNGRCALHFTVRDDGAAFRERAAAVPGNWHLGFSVQDPSTDTLATDELGAPLRVGGDLLLRPGGHGALLANLQRLARTSTADVVLVKNVDNVQPLSRREEGLVAQRLLVGKLVGLVETAHDLVRRLAADDPAAMHDAVDFLDGNFLPAATTALGLSREELSERLDRPIRVCGMVPAVGATGGGPFWAADAGGLTTAQIVETAEVGDSALQRSMVASSTHFNPVLMALGLRDFRGEPHELGRFVDPRRAFISRKTAGGRTLLALEHPGLWNGSMAGWNTLFVEVPAAAFSPVKTVLDLLKAEHQPC